MLLSPYKTVDHIEDKRAKSSEKSSDATGFQKKKLAGRPMPASEYLDYNSDN